MPALCRDCLNLFTAGPRCENCRSPRVVSNDELDTLRIAHVDCDAFFAAVEKRDDPTLADKPVIIGGGRRGVVATACYVARTYGVRSAMPMFKALAACPDAVVIRPDMEKYRIAGRAVREMMLALTPLVEPLSIDEAFLDLSGTETLHGGPPAVVLARFAQEVRRQVGITVSIGLSHNKFLAKMASDLDKPQGFSAIGNSETLAFLENRPVGMIWGVGKAMQERLARDGVRLIGDLRRFDEAELFRRYGSEGHRLHRLARGVDTRRVSPERETKSVSAETTFDKDIGDFNQLSPILWELCEKISNRLKSAGLAARGVSLKLKTADFRTLTRARSGLPATQLAKRLYQPAKELLAGEAKGWTVYRLIGIGAIGLQPADAADSGDLLDTEIVRDKAAETALDAIRAKFGDAAVIRGTAIRPDGSSGRRRGE
jgi:DNA polymerase-4